MIRVSGFQQTWMVASSLGSPPDSGENDEPSPFSIVNSTVPLPASLQNATDIVALRFNNSSKVNTGHDHKENGTNLTLFKRLLQ